MFDPSTTGIISLVLSVVATILLLCTFIILIVYKYQKRQISYFKQIEEIKVKNSQSLLQCQLEIQDETFKNVSMELNSNVGQKLTVVKIQLTAIKKEKRKNPKKIVKNAYNKISVAIEELREVSRSMSADIIINYGLLQGIETEFENLVYKKIKFDFTIIGTVYYLSSYDELVIFRIIQDAFKILVKHSKGNVITFKLFYNDKTLNLEIEDNGAGFNNVPDHMTETGISYIRKRTRLLSGTCKFSNDLGAKIEVEIPVLIKYEKGDLNIHSKKLKLYAKPIGSK